jgi:hypothetical protein
MKSQMFSCLRVENMERLVLVSSRFHGFSFTVLRTTTFRSLLRSTIAMPVLAEPAKCMWRSWMRVYSGKEGEMSRVA